MKFMQVQRQRGQISVLIVFTLIPLFTLLAFAINIGMLVNAKISLQNAADLAAYAGAATQARQMTHISHLNYEMREAYKKFLYKYYVLGNISLKCFPRGGGVPPGCPNATQGPMKWENLGCSNPPCVPGVPSVCISLSTESNVCQLGQAVPNVKPPSCIPLDPTCQALANASATIEAIQQKSCEATSVINQEVLTNWLFATDFNIQMQSNTNLQGLINDIGLVTEELLLKSRIETVQDYINQVARANVTQATARSLQDVNDQAKVERTILAFKTAFGNLNPNVFDTESISLTELIPSGPPFLLNLKPITAGPDGFDTAFSIFQPNQSNHSCDTSVSFLHAKPVVGFVKEPTSYVYYAVKLKAKAQLLFNPFPLGGRPDDRIELTAYAAAAPFGSRIGPDLDPKQFVKPGTPASNPDGKSQIDYPFLTISNDINWDDVRILSAYHKTLKATQNGNVGTGAVGQEDLLRGVRAAQMPDEVEVGQYNIPVDIPEDQRRNDSPPFLVPYYANNNDEYSFWAPVVKIGGNDEFKQQMEAEIESLSPLVGNSQVGNNQITQTKEAQKDLLLSQLDNFLGTLRSRNNFNVARIKDPIARDFFNKHGPQPSIPGKVLNANALASSYTTDKDDYYRDHGRDGYSVKIIPFRNLFNSAAKLTNIGGGVNIPPVTETFQGERAELLKIPH